MSKVGETPMIIFNGATGGTGRYLAPVLDDHGQRYHAIAARLEDRPALDAELRTLDPGGSVTFIHLAARVSVPQCEADPDGAYRVNVTLASETLTAVSAWAKELGARLRVIYVSSGHVYATPPEGSRTTELDSTAPRSVYGATKLKAEADLGSVARAFGSPFLVARVFGLIAPRQAPNYVLPGLIERVRDGRLQDVPGLDFSRDYLDARDVCEDLWLLAQADRGDQEQVVNVCSGVPVTIRDMLTAAARAIDPHNGEAVARNATAAPGRPDDVRWLVGDPTRFMELTGAVPQRIPLERTVADAVAR